MGVEKLTTILIRDFNPKFLVYDFFDENINIVICSDCFINQSMGERIKSVYLNIEKNCPEIFEKSRIFVNAFTQEELVDVLEYFQEEGTQ